MNVIRACSLRYLKENKKRTIVTMAGVALATGLITATACMIMSFYASSLEHKKQTYGDAHVDFRDVKGENLKYFEQNQNLESLGYLSQVGLADLQMTRQGRVYLKLRAVDAGWYRRNGVKLALGRMPEKEDEIIVGRDIRTEFGMDYKVGDQICLKIGQRMAGDQVLTTEDRYREEEEIRADEERTYTIVGLFQGGKGLESGIDIIYAYTYLDLAGVEDSGYYNVSARYTKWGMKHFEQVNAGLADVAGSIVADDDLIMWESMDIRNNVVQSMAALLFALFLFIILIGIFSIINSFDISLTEKIRFYGMMSSVGTTKRQRRQLVWSEAFYIGSLGITSGLALGVLFAYGLVKFVNVALSRQIGYELVFEISWPSLLAAVFFSALMVFLSAVESADRAAKISPIEAIRSNKSIKNPGKPRKTPGYIKKVFGMGGSIAYQNFQRAKVKYRTIVITLVVSISVFVGMSALRYAFDAVEKDMEHNYRYQLRVSTRDSESFEKLKSLAKLPGVLRAEITKDYLVKVEPGGVTRSAGGACGDFALQEESFPLLIVIMDEESFRSYCGQVGISYEENKGRAIVNAQIEKVTNEITKVARNVETIAEFWPGDVVSGRWPFQEGLTVSVEVACQTEELPMSYSISYGCPLFFVSESWAGQQSLMDPAYGERANLTVHCEDANALEDAIFDSDLIEYHLSNLEADYQYQKNVRLVITVFLIGFIIVIILLGVTNVYNALTTNMELRAPEFASLRATGMTGKEFRNMIWVEGLFYGGRALLIGLPIGIGVSYGVYWAILSYLGDKNKTQIVPYEYHFPVLEILISVIAIAVLIYVTMRYCMKKIGRRNIIETIRNENI